MDPEEKKSGGVVTLTPDLGGAGDPPYNLPTDTGGNAEEDPMHNLAEFKAVDHISETTISDTTPLPKVGLPKNSQN